MDLKGPKMTIKQKASISDRLISCRIFLVGTFIVFFFAHLSVRNKAIHSEKSVIEIASDFFLFRSSHRQFVYTAKSLS